MDETFKSTDEQDRDKPAPLPRGWTYLIHGTDTERWDVHASVVRVTGMGLSVMTLEHLARNREQGRYDTTVSAAQPRSEGAHAIEIRVPFYREDLSPSRGVLTDAADIKEGLDPRTLELIGRYHQHRHAVIPRDELLLSMGSREEEGRTVQYMVPVSVLELYLQSVEQETGQKFTLQSERPV